MIRYAVVVSPSINILCNYLPLLGGLVTLQSTHLLHVSRHIDLLGRLVSRMLVEPICGRAVIIDTIQCCHGAGMLSLLPCSAGFT